MWTRCNLIQLYIGMEPTMTTISALYTDHDARSESRLKVEALETTLAGSTTDSELGTNVLVTEKSSRGISWLYEPWSTLHLSTEPAPNQDPTQSP
jgi:hypothetical protein